MGPGSGDDSTGQGFCARGPPAAELSPRPEDLHGVRNTISSRLPSRARSLAGAVQRRLDGPKIEIDSFWSPPIKPEVATALSEPRRRPAEQRASGGGRVAMQE